MLRMLKYAALLALVGASLSGASAAPTPPLNMTEFRVGADPDYRPMAWTNEKGEEVGYDVDFAAELADYVKRTAP